MIHTKTLSTMNIIKIAVDLALAFKAEENKSGVSETSRKLYLAYDSVIQSLSDYEKEQVSIILKNNKSKIINIEKIIEQNPMFKSFRKYFNQDQEGKNDYERGCIQTANALMPVIAELIIQLQDNK